MEWFKFYNSKWLSDLAILSLSPIDRLCFITLLCVTAQCDERTGTVTQYHEHRILTLTHLSDDEYKEGIGFTKRLVEVGLIEQIDDTTIHLKNFEKRQNSNLSGAERAKKYRDKSKSDERSKDKVTNVTPIRVEKIRLDKRKRGGLHSSIKYLSNIPKEDVKIFTDRFEATEKQIMGKAEDLKLYCESKGRIYKNYKSFLLNALRKDFPERSEEDRKKPKMRAKLNEDGSVMTKDGSVVMVEKK